MNRSTRCPSFFLLLLVLLASASVVHAAEVPENFSGWLEHAAARGEAVLADAPHSTDERDEYFAGLARLALAEGDLALASKLARRAPDIEGLTARTEIALAYARAGEEGKAQNQLSVILAEADQLDRWKVQRARALSAEAFARLGETAIARRVYNDRVGDGAERGRILSGIAFGEAAAGNEEAAEATLPQIQAEFRVDQMRWEAYTWRAIVAGLHDGGASDETLTSALQRYKEAVEEVPGWHEGTFWLDYIETTLAIGRPEAATEGMDIFLADFASRANWSRLYRLDQTFASLQELGREETATQLHESAARRVAEIAESVQRIEALGDLGHAEAALLGKSDLAAGRLHEIVELASGSGVRKVELLGLYEALRIARVLPAGSLSAEEASRLAAL